jgi:hypothetical protein
VVARETFEREAHMKAIRRVLMGVAYAMGGVPTDAHWINRLQHLHGEFRRTPADWWSVVFAAGVCVAFGGLCVGLMIGTARDPEPLFAPAWFALPAVALFGLAVAFVRKLDIRYQFEDGEVLAVRRGVVLWREDLAGLTRVTATQGRSGIISMKLIWPDHRRRMELYRSVQAAVGLPR